MRFAVLYTPAPPGAPPEDVDGVIQMEAVSKTLQALGHTTEAVPCVLNLAQVRDALTHIRPDCVFNIVEAIDSHDRLLYLAPALLEGMGIPFTGAGVNAMMLSTGKLVAKRIIRGAGLPTADWVDFSSYGPCPLHKGDIVIFKSAWDHGSPMVTDNDIKPFDDPATLKEQLKSRVKKPGQEWFVERYIEGREFNIAMLAGPDGPHILPAAEILFIDYEKGKPKVVGYNAKWAEESFEYTHTPRTFDFGKEDAPIVEKITRLARDCWNLFGLSGYARVDFRVDADGNPWILEVNANPCIAPDAGYAAALNRAGITYAQAIERIVNDAVGWGKQPPKKKRKSSKK
jgi:D-alanine-D-alanine ligase